jgi:hypothetical protein
MIEIIIDALIRPITKSTVKTALHCVALAPRTVTLLTLSHGAKDAPSSSPEDREHTRRAIAARIVSTTVFVMLGRDVSVVPSRHLSGMLFHVCQ